MLATAAPTVQRCHPASRRRLPLRLTLDEAIAQATANSHRLGELRAREAAARAAADQRGAAQKPIVTTQLGYQRTNHVDEFGFLTPEGGFRVLYPDVPDNYRARIELQWPIYTGGRLQALERAARAEAEFSGQELATARADLKLEVTRAFWALLTARESAARARRGAQAGGRAARRRAVRASTRGSCRRTMCCRSRRSARGRQVSLIEAKNLAAVTEADLARLIGAGDGAAISLDAVLEPPGAPQTADPAALLTEARAGRTERAGLQIRTRIAEERQTAARAGRLPAVSLVTGFDYARPNPRIFPRVRRVAPLVGRRREPELDRLGCRTHAVRGGGGREPDGGDARAAGRVRHDAGARDPPAHARSRLHARRRSRRPARAFARPPKRGASCRSASRPAWRLRPTCSTRRSRCCRRSSIARARSRTPGWRARGSTARWDADGRHHRSGSHPALRRVHGRRPRQLRGRPGRGVRLPRRERRGQVHDHPHALRPAPADERHGRRRRHRRDARSGRRQAAHRLHVPALLAVRGAHGRPEHPLLRRHLRARRRGARSAARGS